MDRRIKKPFWGLGLIGLIIGIFFIKELFWAYLVPVWQAPDEPAHFGYLQSMYKQKDFPILGEATFTSLGFDSMGRPDPGRNAPYVNWIAQHPPLYYLVLAPIYGIIEMFLMGGTVIDPVNWIFYLRIFSILLSCVTLFFIYKTSDYLLTVMGQNRFFSLAVVGFIAFLPGFSYISALLNNDNLVIALSSILFYLLAKRYYGAAQDKSKNMPAPWPRSDWLIGLILGLMALTKITALPFWIAVFVLELIFFKGSAEKKGVNHGEIRALMRIFGLAILISGWWYIRNWYLYGTIFPDLSAITAHHPELLTKYSGLDALFPEIMGSGAKAGTSLWGFIFDQNFLWQYFKSFWGEFGMFMVNLGSLQNAGILALVIVAGLGHLKKYLLKPKNAQTEAQVALKPWVFLLIPFLCVFVTMSWKLFQIYSGRGFLGANHGRYMYSVLLPVAYFIVSGFYSLFQGRKQAFKTGFVLTGVLITLVFLCVLNEFFTLTGIIIPEFY
ncbi:MAG TPA: hypothetical protein P5229_00880 [Candidatus Gracilibacteria bacterium]|nr:hypothetical protein [Candidatus Gracilibacteria bacterium]